MKLPSINKGGQKLHVAFGTFLETSIIITESFNSVKELASFMKQRYYANRNEFTYFYE